MGASRRFRRDLPAAGALPLTRVSLSNLAFVPLASKTKSMCLESRAARGFRLRLCLSVAAERRMNRVLLPNLFFEDELQSPKKAASPNARQFAAELGPVMGLLALENFASDIAFAIQPHRRSIVLVADDARPDDVPPALQGIDFLTIDDLTASVTQKFLADPSNATARYQTPRI